MRIFRTSGIACVQYHGSDLTTQSCLDAIARLLQSQTQIIRAFLLTYEGRHGYFLDVREPVPIVIRSGFSSGYPGEGPAGLAISLHLFNRFDIKVEEVLVSGELLARVDEARLTENDVEFILASPVVRPIRTYDYMYDGLRHRGSAEEKMRGQFSPVVPWFAIDERLIDLGLTLMRDPDKAVFEAFRRLESLVNKRCSLPESVSGVEVFKKAFRGSGAKLVWPSIPPSEVEGRAQLFEAAFMAYRNPLAHKEEAREEIRAYREFYVVNELFLLEAEAQLAS